MKFRDPKTGEVFDDIHQATDVYCTGKDCVGSCALMSNALLCYQWVENNPAEAARRMGFEMVEDKEEATKKLDKPRICEVLGVEVEQPFNINYPCRDYNCLVVRPDGKVWETGPYPHKIGNNALYYLIEHKDEIIRKPRFTQEEVAKAAYLHGAWGENARLRRTSSNTLTLEQGEGLWRLPNEWFPSLRPGQSAALSGILGGDAP